MGHKLSIDVFTSLINQDTKLLKETEAATT